MNTVRLAQNEEAFVERRGIKCAPNPLAVKSEVFTA